MSGLAPASISWTDNNVGTYLGGVDGLTVLGGSGGNTFAVHSTSKFYLYTLLDTGAGNDTVNVLATGGPLYVQNTGGSDHTTIGSAAPALGGTLSGIQGAVQVFGQGSNSLVLDDSGDTSARTITLNDGSISGLPTAPIAWSDASLSGGGVTALSLYAGSGGNTVNITNTGNFAAGTYVNSGAGFNSVNVLATTGPLNLDGGTGGQDVALGGQSSRRPSRERCICTTRRRAARVTCSSTIKTIPRAAR